MTTKGSKANSAEPESARQPGSPGTRLYRGAVRAFSLAFIVLGLAILGTTLANGGGPLSVGVPMGLAFVAVGAGRLWVSSRMSR